MMRKFAAGAAMGAIALLVPATASASTASKTGNTVTVDGGGNEANVILISFDAIANNYVITDSAKITANPTCVQVNDTTVTCPNGTVTNLVVNAGNRDDRVTLDAATIPATLASTLNGDQGKDALVGADSRDTVNGGQNEDSLDGRRGADTYSGGSGSDSVSYTSNPSGVKVSVGAGTGDDGNAFDSTLGVFDTVGADVEAIFGSPFNDLINGDGSGESLFGLGGTDSVRGLAGNDKVSGGADDDRVVGGAGGDRVIGKGGRDVLKGNSGIDILKARDGQRDGKINCGSGRNRFERAKVDRIDPDDKNC